MIVIIDYGMGNPGSILNMIRKVGGEAIISSDIKIIESASKIILPGVGSFDNAMRKLSEMGLKEIIFKVANEKKTIFLGICLGMQLLLEGSEEGIENGLGLIKGRVKKFHFESQLNLKVPHMGWNVISIKKSKLFSGINNDQRFYFVHSYFVECIDQEDIMVTSEYGHKFTCGIQKDNIYGVQFHPEKSHKFGMNFFKNFINL